jgi:hypothetical protein
MRMLTIVLSVAVILFTVVCGFTHQLRETNAINVLSMLLSFELIRIYGKKKT